MKRLIKKITAASAGGLMLISALGGALAAGETLASLPAPFVVSDAYVSTAMVVGSAAGTNDDAARSTLKTYFDGLATAEAAGLGDLIQTEEVKLQDNIATSTGLDTLYDDSDSNIFQDSEVSIGGTGYDFHTELQVNSTTDRFDVETSLTSNDDKYETDPKLEIKKDSLKYCYVFDEHINVTGKVSATNPFDMKFLGKDIRITSTTNTTITAEVGDRWVGHPGQTYTGNGITMEVISVDATTAIVDFGNDQRTVTEGSTISKGEIDIYLDTAITGVENLQEGLATFVIGEDARTTYSDGDKYTTYCSPTDGHGDPSCDKDNPDWIWDIKSLNAGQQTTGYSGSVNSICIENDFEAYNANKEPAGVGEYYGLPNGFIYLGIDDLTVVDSDYMTISMISETGNIVDLSNAGYPSDAVVLSIESTESEGLAVDQSALNWSSISSDVKTDTIYLWANNSNQSIFSVLYVDSNNKVQIAGNVNLNTTTAGNNETVTFGYLNYKNTKGGDVVLKLAGNNATDDTTWLGFVPDSSLSANDNLWFRINTDIDVATRNGIFEGFGDTDNDESDEVVWTSNSGSRVLDVPSLIANSTNYLIGGKTRDLRTGYGIIVENTDSAGDNDQFVVKVPGDQVKANVAVYEGGAATAIAPVLVTETGASGYDKLILVGGPCVNSLTAEYMGVTYPACESASGIAPDTAVIKLVEMSGKTALIVAGWEKADTQRAASSVAAGGLTGTEQIV